MPKRNVDVMKNSTRWITVLAVGMGVTLMGTSCTKYGKRTSKKGGYTASDYLSVDGSSDMETDDLPLGEVPFGDPGSFNEGQFAPVHFAYDSAQIVPDELDRLEAVAEALRQNPEARMIVEGHCDERGSPRV